MSKILYPVGTRVVVKAVKDHSPLYVVAYKKGTKYPYRVGTRADDPASEVGIEGKSKFSVKGLKRYSPNEPKKATESAPKVVETTKRSDMPQPAPQCQCDMSQYYTKQDVNNIIDSVVQQTVHELVETEARVTSMMLDVAGMTDRNFCKVKKALKSLEHNDD